MTKKTNLLQNEEQIVLSYELLQLMDWLMKYEPEGLKKLISKAFKRGLSRTFSRTIDSQNLSALSADTVANFISLLEVLLVEAGSEQENKSSLNRDLLPELGHIDLSNCHYSVIQSSAEVAFSKKEKNPNENTQELLYKELLKRWKPHKKQYEN